jgi:rhodanese-related sulfurtransferase
MFNQLTGLRFFCLCICMLAYSSAWSAELVNIDNAELQGLLTEKTLIIDVRRVEEWSTTGVIENSRLLTFFDQKGNYDAEKWQGELSKLSDASTPVILICRSGSRSKMIGNWMVNSLGYEKVFNVTDGIVGWKGAAGKTVSPD